MKCSIIDRSTICFDHLATPLQHTVDLSLYATLIQVGQALCKMRWNSSKEVSSFTILLAFRLMLSQRFSMGLQSGDLAGHSIHSMPFSSRNWSATRARWGLALSSIKTNSSPMAAAYGTTCGSNTSSTYRRAVNRPGTGTRSVFPWVLMPPHIITLPTWGPSISAMQSRLSSSPTLLQTLTLLSIFFR